VDGLYSFRDSRCNQLQRDLSRGGLRHRHLLSSDSNAPVGCEVEWKVRNRSDLSKQPSERALLEQLAGLDLQRLGNSLKHRHCWVPYTALNPRNVGPVQAGFISQPLLAYSSIQPDTPDICADTLADFHDQLVSERTPLIYRL